MKKELAAAINKETEALKAKQRTQTLISDMMEFIDELLGNDAADSPNFQSFKEREKSVVKDLFIK